MAQVMPGVGHAAGERARTRGVGGFHNHTLVVLALA
jgi:hypothetical protein